MTDAAPTLFDLGLPRRRPGPALALDMHVTNLPGNAIVEHHVAPLVDLGVHAPGPPVLNVLCRCRKLVGRSYHPTPLADFTPESALGLWDGGRWKPGPVFCGTVPRNHHAAMREMLGPTALLNPKLPRVTGYITILNTGSTPTRLPVHCPRHGAQVVERNALLRALDGLVAAGSDAGVIEPARQRR